MTTLELILTFDQGPPLCYRYQEPDDLARTVTARLLALMGDEQQRPPPRGSGHSNGSLATRVYTVLAKLADTSGWCRACQDEIASRAGLSTRHLRRGITALEAAGLVQIRRRERKWRNAYFLPGLVADMTMSLEDMVMSGMKEDIPSEGMSAMIHDDHDDETNQKHLLFLHEGERRKRLHQSHLTVGYLEAWDSWWAAGQFGRLRNPAGWANAEIKQGHWPPVKGLTLFEHSPDPEPSGEVSTRQTAKPRRPEDMLWSQILAQLQLQLTRATFDVWLKGTRLISRDGPAFTIATQSGFARDWLENRLQPTLCRVIAQVTQVELSSIKLVFVVD
jgi:hypothetical protein